MTIHLPKRVIEHYIDRSFLDMRYVMMIASLVIEKALTHRCSLLLISPHDLEYLVTLTISVSIIKRISHIHRQLWLDFLKLPRFQPQKHKIMA